MILTAIHGFCMALADSVPGVSGGTIAFILGFYDRFLDALHSLFGKDNAARRAVIVFIRFAGAPVWMLAYLFVSGAAAIPAMVLPGISGSTILLIAGVYLPTIQAIRAFLRLDLSVLPGLCALGFGILAGIGLSIHAIRAALKKYRPQMVWLILGLMAGSLYAIVMGPASLDVPQAPVGLQSFDLLGFALGIAVLLGLEALRKWTAQQASSKAMPEKRTVT